MISDKTRRGITRIGTPRVRLGEHGYIKFLNERYSSITESLNAIKRLSGDPDLNVADLLALWLIAAGESYWQDVPVNQEFSFVVGPSELHITIARS